MSEVKVNKLSPRSGTTVTLGDSGDTFTVPSGVTFDASSGGLAGTLTTAAQPNITSVGTLTSFTSTGIDDNATSTAITIDSSGDVGINIASPNLNSFNKAVTLSGTTNAGYELAKGSTLHGAFALQGDNRVQLINFQDADLTFNTGTGATERMRVVHSTGNVGIGTSSPTAKLQVNGNFSLSTLPSGTSSSSYRQAQINLANFSDSGGNNSATFWHQNGYIGSGNNSYAVTSGTGTSHASRLGMSSGVLTYNNAYPVTADTAISFSERFRITSNGNVGIGTSSPSFPLEIYRSSTAEVAIGSSANGTAQLSFYETDLVAKEFFIKYDGANNNGVIGTSAVSNAIVIARDSGNVGIGTSSPSGDGLTIYGSTNDTILTFQNPQVTTGFRFDMGESGYSHQVLRLYDNSNRALVNFDGQIGLTSFGSVQGEVDAGEKGVSIRGSVGQVRIGQDGTGLSTVMGFYNPNGEVGTIRTTGSSTQFNTSSDYRLKENVSYDFDATSRLKQLKPARFNFIADADTTVDGFIAHEVSSIVPEAISGEKDETETKEKVVVNANGNIIAENIEQADWETGKIADENGNTQYPTDSTWEATKVVPVYQGIDQSKLVPLLVKTIQELEARITTLENA
jgi:hypothetical protein